MASTTGTLTDASPDSSVITLTVTDPHIEVFNCNKWDQIQLLHSIDGSDPTVDQSAHVFNGSGKVQIKAEVGDKIKFEGNFPTTDVLRSITWEIRS